MPEIRTQTPDTPGYVAKSERVAYVWFSQKYAWNIKGRLTTMESLLSYARVEAYFNNLPKSLTQCHIFSVKIITDHKRRRTNTRMFSYSEFGHTNEILC